MSLKIRNPGILRSKVLLSEFANDFAKINHFESVDYFQSLQFNLSARHDNMLIAELDDAVLEIIATEIGKLQNLQQLSFDASFQYYVTDKGLDVFAKKVFGKLTKLKSLKLIFRREIVSVPDIYPITEEGFKAFITYIAKNLKNIKSLQRLELDFGCEKNSWSQKTKDAALTYFKHVPTKHIQV